MEGPGYAKRFQGNVDGAVVTGLLGRWNERIGGWKFLA